ncbi:MAG: glucuronyl hydrolase, partial [Bacteroides sp.]|nr:glucuronyl hydrolase [Bacteroides sp.]
MNLKTSILTGCAALLIGSSCSTPEQKVSWPEKAVENARAQIGMEIDTIEDSGKCLNPVTI